MKTINVKESQCHKKIMIRARACSTCGQKSGYVSRSYYVACRAATVQLADVSTENKERYKIFSVLQPCQKIYYTTDGTEPTLTSPCLDNSVDVIELEQQGNTTREIKTKILCTIDGNCGPLAEKKAVKCVVAGVSNALISVNGAVLGFKTVLE